MYALKKSLQHTLRLLGLLCLHWLPPGNDFQSRIFLSFSVQRFLSLLAGSNLTSQLGVAWPQSSNNSYSSFPYGSRTAFPTHLLWVNVRVMLPLAVYRQSVRFGVRPLEDHDRSLFPAEPLRLFSLCNIFSDYRMSLSLVNMLGLWQVICCTYSILLKLFAFAKCRSPLSV
jgi:hypothetical protein